MIQPSHSSSDAGNWSAVTSYTRGAERGGEQLGVVTDLLDDVGVEVVAEQESDGHERSGLGPGGSAEGGGVGVGQAIDLG